MNKMKAQTAMEYLMTYGWAILIVIIVGAALYALGIFNPATYTQSTATGFQGFQIPTGGWQFVGSSGILTLKVKNMAGSNINITSVQGVYAGETATNSTMLGMVSFAPGSDFTILVDFTATASSGAAYSIPVTISYTNLDSGLTFTSQGTVTGTVS